MQADEKKLHFIKISFLMHVNLETYYAGKEN